MNICKHIHLIPAIQINYSPIYEQFFQSTFHCFYNNDRSSIKAIFSSFIIDYGLINCLIKFIESMEKKRFANSSINNSIKSSKKRHQKFLFAIFFLHPATHDCSITYVCTCAGINQLFTLMAYSIILLSFHDVNYWPTL